MKVTIQIIKVQIIKVTLQILVALWILMGAAPHSFSQTQDESAQTQDESALQDAAPETLIDCHTRRQQLFAEISNQPEMPVEEKISRYTKMVGIENKVIANLESGNAGFLEGAGDADISAILHNFQLGTVDSGYQLAKLLRAASRYKESLEATEAVVNNSRIVYGNEHWRTLEFQLRLNEAKWLVTAAPSQLATWNSIDTGQEIARTAYANQNWIAAVNSLTDAAIKLENLNLQNTMTYGEVVANLAEMVAGSGQLDEAETAFLKAIEVNDKLFARSSPTNANMRRTFSEVMRRSGKHEQAVVLLKESIGILQQFDPQPSPQWCESLFLLGLNYQQLKQFDAATKSYYDSYAMLQNLGLQHGEFGTNLTDNILAVFQAMGGLDSAGQPQDMTADATKVADRVFGENSADAAQWLLILAGKELDGREMEQGSTERSIDLFAQAANAFEETENFESNPDYLNCLKNGATGLYNSGKTDEAFAMLERSLELARKSAGENSMLFATHAQNLAVLYCRSGMHDQSEQLFAGFMPFLRETMGANHVEYQRIINDRAVNLSQGGNWGKAIEQWQMLVSLQEADLNQNGGTVAPDSEYVATLKHLLNAYVQSGDQESADRIRERIDNIKRV